MAKTQPAISDGKINELDFPSEKIKPNTSTKKDMLRTMFHMLSAYVLMIFSLVHVGWKLGIVSTLLTNGNVRERSGLRHCKVMKIGSLKKSAKTQNIIKMKKRFYS